MPSSLNPQEHRSIATKVKLVALGLAVGVVLGIVGTVFVQNHNPKDAKPVDMTSVVFDRIVSQNELVSVSQDYMIVDKAVGDNSKLFDLIEVPFTENSFWYRYAGTIKAGVSLEGATYRQDGNTIYVHITDPYIISNEPDMEVTGVLEENNNSLNPIHVADVDEFQRECIQKSEENSINKGLLEEARANAESNIRNMFVVALGDEYTVEFE